MINIVIKIGLRNSAAFQIKLLNSKFYKNFGSRITLPNRERKEQTCKQFLTTDFFNRFQDKNI